RFSRDWSSDVCSSDLTTKKRDPVIHRPRPSEEKWLAKYLSNSNTGTMIPMAMTAPGTAYPRMATLVAFLTHLRGLRRRAYKSMKIGRAACRETEESEA